MGFIRFVAAQILREKAGWPMGAGPPLLVTTSVIMHSATAYAFLLAPTPGLLELGMFTASYSARMFGITGGFHRYFAHNSYKTSRPMQFVLGLLGTAAWQRGPLWWASHHIEHHNHSDTIRDSHSPVTGSLYWAHMGWFWASREHDPHPQRYTEGRQKKMERFEKFPELKALDKYHHVPGIALLATCYALDGGAGLLWGFAVPTVAVWHNTFMVNSVCHVWGSRRFATMDQSRNNPLVALLTFGEGWHNNHHAFHWSAAQGLKWYELDISYMIIKGFEKAGLVWDVKVPTQEQVTKLEAKSLDPAYVERVRVKTEQKEALELRRAMEQ